MDAVRRDRRRSANATARIGALAALALILGMAGLLSQGAAFAGAAPALRLQRVPRTLPGGISTVRRAEADDKEVVEAEVLGDEEEPEEQGSDVSESSGAYPPEAYGDYTFDAEPPSAYFDRRKIDRHKVNNVFFDMFKKPKTFFPHDLKPGDTIRVAYLDARNQGDRELKELKVDAMRQVVFDGVIMNFKGEYQARTVTLRAMVGSGMRVMGEELQFPIHSPLIRRIEVLRRGYIGRNKNAYFIRGMIGKKNIIPLDQERTQTDEMYAFLKEEGREDEIPEPEYPTTEYDRYPLPIWKQDMDDWDEEQYDPDNVDLRSEYERRVIDRFKKRIPGQSGKPR